MWFLSVAEGPQGLENPTFFLFVREGVGFFFNLLFLYHFGLCKKIEVLKFAIGKTINY